MPRRNQANVMPLYPDENTVARLVLGERAKDWPNIAPVLERQGLPAVNSLFGGRYWPAVKAWLDRYNGLSERAPPQRAESKENLECLKPKPPKRPDSSGAPARTVVRFPTGSPPEQR